MGRCGVGFDRASFAVVLKACGALEECNVGVQVHGLLVKFGFDSDVVTGSALLGMYAKFKRLDDSLAVFSELPEKNWVSWSAMIAGCVQNDRNVEGLELFKEMQGVGVGVSQSIYASLFRSCAGLSALKLGKELHSHALKSAFGTDIIVGTATLDMYAKCGRMADAQKVLNSMPKCSLQSYNAIIVGYARSDRGFQALKSFQLLLKIGLGFDEITLSGALNACASIRGDLEGRQVHGLANGNEEETLAHFASMLHSRMEPDEFTYGSVLKACAGRQALNTGMEIHTRIIKSGMGFESFVGAALVDMYCKCGMVEKADKIHDRTEQKTMVSWNAIISGFSLLQQSEDAHNFFSRMLEMGVKPDNFTYAAVLDTCANLATVGLGKQIHAQIIKQELQSDASTWRILLGNPGKWKLQQLNYHKNTADQN
ncbi:hypothetical protein OIU78_000798 [Salix suchowensis]|nr:hypothetical protein OIU78_000798 [Salix suchowensis]